MYKRIRNPLMESVHEVGLFGGQSRSIVVGDDYGAVELSRG